MGQGLTCPGLARVPLTVSVPSSTVNEGLEEVMPRPLPAP